MASLNHVCMWTEHGWRRVTAEEAATLHRGGTVSAHSGLFMCELCGQYVTLTDGYIRDRYFRHSAAEANKNCPERTFGANYRPSYRPEDYDLPIRIVVSSSARFSLELGLISVPESLLHNSAKKTIVIQSSSGEEFAYSFERLSRGSITYLFIGNKPSKEYRLQVTSDLAKYWPNKIQGISNQGAIFDSRTGRLLPNDSDVKLNSKYFLLTTSTYSLAFFNRLRIDCIKQCEQTIGWSTWRIYELVAKELNGSAAKFFLKYHCRLTDSPVEIMPLWPIHIETPFLIKHNRVDMIMHLYGNREIDTRTFPNAEVRQISCGSDGTGKVIKIACNSRQQLITAGKTNVLQYLYYWKEPLSATTQKPSIDVRDGKDNRAEQGIRNTLPEGGLLKVKAQFDGVVSLIKDDQIVERIPITAEKRLNISDLRYGITVQVTQGLDIIWNCSFIRLNKRHTDSDEMLYEKLVLFKGNEIQVQHNLGGAAIKLSDYPKTRQWISTMLIKGSAPEKAIKYLKKYLIKTFPIRRTIQTGEIDAF